MSIGICMHFLPHLTKTDCTEKFHSDRIYIRFSFISNIHVLLLVIIHNQMQRNTVRFYFTSLLVKNPIDTHVFGTEL